MHFIMKNMPYFTSDRHIGHENIIRFSNHPFFPQEEMNRRLMGNCNSRVSDKYDIYILRDLFHRTKEGGGKCLKQESRKKR